MLRSLVLLALFSSAVVLARQIKSIPYAAQAEQSPFVCPLCQGFVHQTELKYQGRIDEFQADLDNWCATYFDIFAPVCVNAFNNRIAEIMDKLEHEYSPYNVCQALALCK